jgi:hypothetical protein
MQQPRHEYGTDSPSAQNCGLPSRSNHRTLDLLINRGAWDGSSEEGPYSLGGQHSMIEVHPDRLVSESFVGDWMKVLGRPSSITVEAEDLRYYQGERTERFREAVKHIKERNDSCALTWSDHDTLSCEDGDGTNPTKRQRRCGSPTALPTPDGVGDEQLPTTMNGIDSEEGSESAQKVTTQLPVEIVIMTEGLKSSIESILDVLDQAGGGSSAVVEPIVSQMVSILINVATCNGPDYIASNNDQLALFSDCLILLHVPTMSEAWIAAITK